MNSEASSLLLQVKQSLWSKSWAEGGGSAGDSRLFGVRSRKEIGYQIVMGRPYWTSFESSSEIPLERTLLFLRTKEGPRACEGPASTDMKLTDPRWDLLWIRHGCSRKRGHLKLGNWGQLIKGLLTQMWARCRKSTLVLWGQEPGGGITPLSGWRGKRREQLGPRRRPVCKSAAWQELWLWIEDTVNLRWPSREGVGNK